MKKEEKKQQIREIRTIYKICSSYVDYLVKKGIIPKAERYEYYNEKQHEVLEA